MMRRTRSLLAGILVVVVAATALAQDGPADLLRPDGKPGVAGKPLRVFILMGQSNMVGMGDIGPETTKGTLEYFTKTQKKYPFLLDTGGKWTVRKDVYYYDARVKKGA